MKKITAFLLFLLSVSSLAHAGKESELFQEYQKATTTRDKILALGSICKYYWEVDPSLAVKYSHQAIDIATAANDQGLLGYAYNYTSIAHFWLKDVYNATYYANKALNIRLQLADSVGLISNYNTFGNILLYQQKYGKALAYYQKSLDLGRALQRTQAISSALSNMGEVYEKQKLYDKALAVYLSLLELDQQTGNASSIALDYLSIGKTYYQLGQVQKGLPYLRKAHALGERLENKVSFIFILQNLTKIYLDLGNQSEALAMGTTALQLSKQYRSLVNLEEVAFLLSKIYEARQDYRTAHRYLVLHNQYQDSIQNSAKFRYFAEMHTKYESDKKEAENEALRTIRDYQAETLAQKNKLQNAIIGLLILAGILALVFFRGKRREKAINATLLEVNQLILQKQSDIQQQKDQLAKLNEQKDLLFSIIAHDLRGPLISLKSLLQLLSIGTLPQDKLDRFVQDLNTQQQNTLALLDNLLVWARLQMSGHEVLYAPQNLHAVLQTVYALMGPIAEKKRVTLSQNVPVDIWATADEESLKLILRNLLSNAIKFCRPGDSVQVSVSVLEQHFVLVAVQDSGVGISPENQARLFGLKPNKQAGTANEKGSGLGLMLCKEFVEKHGGKIWVESTLGQGTTCYFTLPLCVPSFQTSALPQQRAHASLV